MELKVAYHQGPDKAWGHQTYGFCVAGLPDARTAALGAQKAMQDELDSAVWIKMGFQPFGMLIRSGVSVMISDNADGSAVLVARGYARMEDAERGARVIIAAVCGCGGDAPAGADTCAEGCAVDFGEASRDKALRDSKDLFAKK